MNIVRLLFLLSYVYLPIIGGLFKKDPIYYTNIAKMDPIRKIKFKIEVKIAYGKGLNHLLDFLKKHKKNTRVYLYLKDSVIDEFLDDEKLRDKFLEFYEIEDKENPKKEDKEKSKGKNNEESQEADKKTTQENNDEQSQIPSPPVQPPLPLKVNRSLQQTGVNYFQKNQPQNIFKFTRETENNIPKSWEYQNNEKISQLTNNATKYRPSARKLYETDIKTKNLNNNSNGLSNNPAVEAGQYSANDPGMNSMHVNMGKRRQKIIKKMLKNQNNKENLALTNKELQYLYTLASKEKKPSSKEQDSAATYGERLCKSETQKRVYYRLLKDVDYNRLVKPLTGALAVIAGYRVLREPEKDWEFKITTMKLEIENLKQKQRWNVESLSAHVKKIEELVENVEEFYSDMSFNLISKARTLNAIAWKKLYMEGEEESCEEEFHGDEEQLKSSNKQNDKK